MKKGIIYSFIISLVICMIMPFSVFASTSGNQVGFTMRSSYTGNLKLFRYETQAIYPSTGGQYTYAYYFQTDPGLYGVISGRMNDSTSELFTVAVQNGISEVFYSNQNSTYVYSVILVEYNQALPQYVIDYIANIDENIGITTDLIDQLVSYRQWNFPLESFTAIYPFMLKYTPQDLTTYNSYSFPLFDVKQGDIMFNGLYTSNTYYDTTLIFGINELLYDSNFNQVMTPTNQNYTRSVPETISRVLISSNPNVWYQIVRVDFHYSGTGTTAFGIQFNKDFRILPIYWNLKGNQYLSTDFALQFGLSNKLLDDIHLIASGTQQSQSAAGDLEQGTSDLASDISSYNQIESNYNNQMNQALNNIDFSDQFSNNQNFLSGASFVKTVFNSFMQIDILRIFFIVLCIVLIAKRFI